MCLNKPKDENALETAPEAKEKSQAKSYVLGHAHTHIATERPIGTHEEHASVFIHTSE